MTSDHRKAKYPHEFIGLPSICSRCGEHEEGLLVENFNCPVLVEHVSRPKEPEATDIQAQNPKPLRKFLHVVFLNGSERWYELDAEGWRFDAMTRELVIGKGLGRKMIPLDNVEYYSPE